jgi:hypothetical protein
MLNRFPVVRLSPVFHLTVAIVFAICGIITTVSAAEDDLVQKLVGTWEGVSLTNRNEQRTLRIESVKREGDQWTGKGRWGQTGNKGNEIELRITVSGNDVQVRFTGGSDNVPISLKLTGDNELNGTMQVRTKGRRLEDAPLKLTKVQS